MRVLRPLILLLAACGSPTSQPSASAPAASTSSSAVVTPVSTAPPPATGAFGWWSVPDVDAASDLRGGHLRFAPASVGVVSADSKIVALRPCKTAVHGDAVVVTGCGPLFSGTLAGDRITVADGYTLTRAPASATAQLETILAEAAKACEQARACYRAAYPLLGRPLDEAFDFGVGPTGDTCANMTTAFADEVKQAGMPVPAACRDQ